jgi:hypothetical protein
VLFSPSHLTVIAVVVLANLYFFHAARRGANDFDKSVGLLLAIVLLVNEIGWHIWNISIGT